MGVHGNGVGACENGSDIKVCVLKKFVYDTWVFRLPLHFLLIALPHGVSDAATLTAHHLGTIATTLA